ncbi:MAG: ankyrin repeat domain-containing protein [Tatlockia sp.]|nr:ankyrin repeat domain-containing protein [Tatlockia sp.]
MLTKVHQNDLEILPEDVWRLIFSIIKNLPALALTNSYFFKLYHEVSTHWLRLLTTQFPNFLNKIVLKGPSWQHQFLQISAQEYKTFDIKQKQFLFEFKNTLPTQRISLLDKVDLGIKNPDTNHTLFNHLLKFAAYAKDQILLDYLFQTLLTELYDVNSVKDLNLTEQSAKTLIHHAVLCHQIELVKDLIDKGFDCYSRLKSTDLELRHRESPEFSDNTPLHLAALVGYEDMVLLLMNNVKDLLDQNSKSQTPLCCAAEAGHEEVVKVIAERVKHQFINDKESSPLWWAVRGVQTNIVQYLLDLGFKADGNGHLSLDCSETPLHLAARSGSLGILTLLMNQTDINPNVNNRYGYTPLFEAVRAGNLEAVKLLLPKASLKAQEGILHHSAKEGHVHVLKYLIDEVKMDFSIYRSGYLPIHEAAENGHREAVSFFLGKGVPIDIETSIMNTALTLAAKNQYFLLVADLLQKKALVNQMESLSGFTALHYPCLKKNTQLEWLISYASDKELPFKPLDFMELIWRKALIKTLIEHGANIYVKDHSGKTPFDHLITHKEWAMAKFFLDLVSQEDRKILLRKIPVEAGIDLQELNIAENRVEEILDDNPILPLDRSLATIQQDNNLKKSVQLKSEKITQRPNKQNQFFTKASNPKVQIENKWDLDNPSLGMIIVAVCIPVLWPYLAYLLFKAVADCCCACDEEQSLPVSR